MGAKLYVGNLPFSATDQELQDFFSAHGNVVSAKVIADRYTGRSQDEAQAAITALHGADMGGRILVVNEAQPQQERRPFSGPPKNPN